MKLTKKFDDWFFNLTIGGKIIIAGVCLAIIGMVSFAVGVYVISEIKVRDAYQKDLAKARILGFENFSEYLDSKKFGKVNYWEYSAIKEMELTEEGWRQERQKIADRGLSILSYFEELKLIKKSNEEEAERLKKKGMEEDREITRFIDECFATSRLMSLVEEKMATSRSSDISKTQRGFAYMAVRHLINTGSTEPEAKKKLDNLIAGYAPNILLESTDRDLHTEKTQNLLREHQIASERCTELFKSAVVYNSIVGAIPFAEAEQKKDRDSFHAAEWHNRCRAYAQARNECAVAQSVRKCIDIKIGFLDAEMGSIYCKGSTPDWWLMGRQVPKE